MTEKVINNYISSTTIIDNSSKTYNVGTMHVVNDSNVANVSDTKIAPTLLTKETFKTMALQKIAKFPGTPLDIFSKSVFKEVQEMTTELWVVKTDINYFWEASLKAEHYGTTTAAGKTINSSATSWVPQTGEMSHKSEYFIIEDYNGNLNNFCVTNEFISSVSSFKNYTPSNEEKSFAKNKSFSYEQKLQQLANERADKSWFSTRVNGSFRDLHSSSKLLNTTYQRVIVPLYALPFSYEGKEYVIVSATHSFMPNFSLPTTGYEKIEKRKADEKKKVAAIKAISFLYGFS